MDEIIKFFHIKLLQENYTFDLEVLFVINLLFTCALIFIAGYCVIRKFSNRLSHLNSKKKWLRYWLLALVVNVLMFPVLWACLLIKDPVIFYHLVNFEGQKTPGHQEELTSRIQHVSRVFVDNFFSVEAVQQNSLIPTIKLYTARNTISNARNAIAPWDQQRIISKEHYQTMTEPEGIKPYFKATYVDEEGKEVKCKIKFRGYSTWHHYSEKPSLRIKFGKNNSNQENRYIELQRPEDILALKNWIPDHFARKLGLMSETLQHVRLFINDKYYGVYLKNKRQDKELEEEYNRSSGTFFKGDRNGVDKWKSSKLWKISGEKDPQAINLFDDFLNSLSKVDFPGQLESEVSVEELNEFKKLFDTENYAKWAALMIVTGGVHTDSTHNHNYYIGPHKNKIESLVWDCNSYGIQSVPGLPPDYVMHSVMSMITVDPVWVHRRNQIMFQLLETVAHPKNIYRLIDEKIDQILPDLKADGNLSSIESTLVGMYLKPWSVLDIEKHRQEIKSFANKRYHYLKKYLASAKVYVRPHPKNKKWSQIDVFGSVAVDVYHKNGESLNVTIYPGLSANAFKYVFKGDGRYVPGLLAAPLTYQIKIDPSDLVFKNAITHEDIVLSTSVDGPNLKPRTIHPSKFLDQDVKFTKYKGGQPLYSNRDYVDTIKDPRLDGLMLLGITRHRMRDISVIAKNSVTVYRLLSDRNDNASFKDWEKTDIQVNVKGITCDFNRVVKKKFPKGKIILEAGGPVAACPILIEE